MTDTIECNMKLKVVWICKVSDPDINDRLKPCKRTPQVSPWISNTADLLSNCRTIELHIISPHEYIAGIRRFCRKGVYYYFYNNNIPIWGRHWPGFFKWDIITDYSHNKKVVKKLVDTIHPDVIHLQGAENPYYSTTALQFLENYPVVVNLQRMTLDFYRGSSKSAVSAVKIEKEILTKFKHFSLRTKKMESDLLSYNPDAITHWVRYIIPELHVNQVRKEYDIVFFAQIIKTKGIEDLIDCLVLVKNSFPEIKLCLMGSSSRAYITFLHNMIKEKGLADNVIWKGFLPSLRDVHNEAQKSRICVLPTHYDIIPGTIIESMQLGLPVVSYNVGSIPELNEEEECVLLSEKGDIQGLADNIIRLLTNAELYNTMSKRGIECIKKRYSNQNVIQQHLDCYRAVIADFHDKQRNFDHRDQRKSPR